MFPLFHPLSFFTLYALSLPQTVSGQNNTTCVDEGSNWYINLVGETPCTTYRRLRQNCNPEYNLDKFDTDNIPGDTCDEQVPDCCCNSVSFALSMLCLTCRKGINVQGWGWDAQPGSYENYLFNTKKGSLCSPNRNQSLPDDIQNGVCNEGIKIPDDLYTLFWPDGAWFYAYTRDQISNNSIAGKNLFTKCDFELSDPDDPPASSSPLPGLSSSSESASASAPSSASSSSASVSSTKSDSLSEGAIAGTSLGAIGLVVFSSVVVWLLWRQQKQIKAEEKRFDFSPDRMLANRDATRPNPAPAPPVQAGVIPVLTDVTSIRS